MTTAVDLRSRVVVATGSSSGIGQAFARRVAACGAGVADELPDAVYVAGDIAAPDTALALVKAAEERWGRLDGLVNNAAVTIDVPFEDVDVVTPEHWERVLSVNGVGTFLVSPAALPLLRRSDDG